MNILYNDADILHNDADNPDSYAKNQLLIKVKSPPDFTGKGFSQG